MGKKLALTTFVFVLICYSANCQNLRNILTIKGSYGDDDLISDFPVEEPKTHQGFQDQLFPIDGQEVTDQQSIIQRSPEQQFYHCMDVLTSRYIEEHDYQSVPQGDIYLFCKEEYDRAIQQ